MKTVLFKKWIPNEYNQAPDCSRQIVPGTGCYSEMNNIGIFHCWGLNTAETESSIASFSVAIIEEQTTGEVFTVIPEHVKFVER